MTKRSQLHERYRKGTEIGSTRKSAARAKPARRAGTIDVPSAAGKGAKGSKGKSGRGKTTPASPAIKRWRIIWWVALGLALVCVVTMFAVPSARDSRPVAAVLAAASLLLWAAAMYIDLVVIRRLSQPVKPQRKSSSSGDASAKAGTGRTSKRGDADAVPVGAKVASSGRASLESEDSGAQEKE